MQELMLLKQECGILNSCNKNAYGYTVSPVDASSGFLNGRPYGGVGFMWKKSIDYSITILELEFDWVCGLKISAHKKRDLHFKCVFTFSKNDNREQYLDCLAKLQIIINNINSICITIVGDFNASLTTESAFSELLRSFCVDSNLSVVDVELLPSDSFSYVSSAWSTTSWIDHIVCTADCRSCITHVDILYDVIHSDHLPLHCAMDIRIIPETNDNNNNRPATIRWDNMTNLQINTYNTSTF